MSYPNPSFWLVNSNSFHQGLGWIFPIHGFVSKPIGFWIFLVSHSCWKYIFSMLFPSEKHDIWWHGYGSIHINTMFNGMNIHLPAILMFTRGTIGFDTLPHVDGEAPFCCWFSEQRRARPIEMTSIPSSPDSCNYSCVSSGSLLAHAGNTEVPEKGGVETGGNIWEAWHIFAWVDGCFFLGWYWWYYLVFFGGMVITYDMCIYIYIHTYIIYINVISNQPLPWDGIRVFFGESSQSCEKSITGWLLFMVVIVFVNHLQIDKPI